MDQTNEALEPIEISAALDLGDELAAAESYALAGLALATLQALRERLASVRRLVRAARSRVAAGGPAHGGGVPRRRARSPIAAATVARRAAAIAYRHRLEQLANPVDTEVVRAVLRASAGSTSSRRRARTRCGARRCPSCSPRSRATRCPGCATAPCCWSASPAPCAVQSWSRSTSSTGLTTDRGVLVTIVGSKTDQEGAGDTVPLHRVLEQRLERTCELVGRARAAGHERVIEINSRDEASLVAILDGLDALENDHTDAGFDLRERVDATDAEAPA
jgi:hypothetical protein